MPTNRTYRSRARVLLSPTEQRYLLDGQWLILANTTTPPGRREWELNRAGLLEIWNDPAGPGTGSLFGPEPCRGAGTCGLPCFAQCAFDGEKLPPRNKTWSPEIYKIWQSIRDSLIAHKKGLKNATK